MRMSILFKKGCENSWWMIVLQILVVLSAIVAVIALWPFLEAACAGLYEGIYNTVCPYFKRIMLSTKYKVSINE